MKIEIMKQKFLFESKTFFYKAKLYFQNDPSATDQQ